MDNFNKESDATIKITIPEKDFLQKEKEQKPSYFPGSYINQQGEDFIRYKLDRPLRVGDIVIYNNDISSESIYKGYLCSIIGAYKQDFYEIQFSSEFNSNDKSRKSENDFPNFEFPDSNYVTLVKGKDIIRVEKHDLFYKTCFS